MKDRYSVDELLRLACIYAERDQWEFLAAIEKTDMVEEIEKTKQFIQQLKEYRIKRWGKTKLEHLIANGTPVPIDQVADRLKGK